MKNRLSSYFIFLCALMFFSIAIHANNPTTTAINSEAGVKLDNTSHTKSLETQVADLQKEMNLLKRQLKLTQKKKEKPNQLVAQIDNVQLDYGDPGTGANSEQNTTSSTTAKKIKTIRALKAKIRAKRSSTTGNTAAQNQNTTTNANINTNATITSATTPSEPDITRDTAPLTSKDLFANVSEQSQYLPFDLDVPGQAFVSTGPYVGVPIQYAGSNLIINSPSVNTDVQLLNIRKKIMQELKAMGGILTAEPYHSHLLLSGIVEVQANYTNPGGFPSTTDIDVTNSAVDFFAIGPSDWTLGFVELMFDNSRAINSAYRISNSRVFVNKAFITIGDFSKSPFYGSIGQYYVPFGTYSTVMVSDVLTKLLTRTKARALTIGFQQQYANAIYGSAYIFRGDSHATTAPKVGNGGLNFGYRFDMCGLKGDVGGGVIASITDSGGMQVGNGFIFYEQLVHRVPGYNARASFDIGEHFNVLGEYVTASTKFNPNDMTFNGHGAKPSAFDVEGAFSFYILEDRPSSIGIGYSHTNQALSLGLPLSRYALVFNTSLWRNTLQSLEFRFDRDYAEVDTANGPVGAIPTQGPCTSAACVGTGKGTKAVTAQFDYYF